MRFLVDDGVPAGVVEVIRRGGGLCHAAREVGMGDASDDDLAVYASHVRIALVTRERRHARGPLAAVAGQVVWLRCGAVEAAEVLQRHLIAVVGALARHDAVVVTVTARSVTVGTQWGE